MAKKVIVIDEEGKEQELSSYFLVWVEEVDNGCKIGKLSAWDCEILHGLAMLKKAGIHLSNTRDKFLDQTGLQGMLDLPDSEYLKLRVKYKSNGESTKV